MLRATAPRNEHTNDNRIVPGMTILTAVTDTAIVVQRSPEWFPSALIPDESGRRTRTRGALIDLVHHE
jgi:hypothetical protein